MQPCCAVSRAYLRGLSEAAYFCYVYWFKFYDLRCHLGFWIAIQRSRLLESQEIYRRERETRSGG